MWELPELTKLDYYSILQTSQPELRLLNICPTLNCNSRCKFCPIWGTNGWAKERNKGDLNEHLNLDKIQSFINDIIKHQPDKRFWVMLAGGEPSLYNDFEQLIQFLHKKQLPSVMLTNGTNLKKYCELIISNKIASLSISLDAPPEIHDSTCGYPGLYEEVISSINYIIDYKRKKHLYFPSIVINCVISEYNAQYVKEFVGILKEQLLKNKIRLNLQSSSDTRPNDVTLRFAPRLYTKEKYGFEYEKELKENFKCESTIDWKGFLADEKLDVKKLNKDLIEIWDLHNVNTKNYIDIEEWFNNYNNTFGYERCLTPWYYLNIKPDGNVFFCPDLKDYSIGNINEQNFLDIWNGKRANEFRDYIKKQPFSVCNRCDGLFTNFSTLKQFDHRVLFDEK